MPRLRVGPRIAGIHLAVDTRAPDRLVLSSPAEPVVEAVVDHRGRHLVRVETHLGDRRGVPVSAVDAPLSPRLPERLDGDLPAPLPGFDKEPPSGPQTAGLRPPGDPL